MPWQKVLLFQVPLADASRTLPPTIDCKCLKIDYLLKVTLDLIPTPGKHSEPLEGKNNSDEWVELQVMFCDQRRMRELTLYSSFSAGENGCSKTAT